MEAVVGRGLMARSEAREKHGRREESALWEGSVASLRESRRQCKGSHEKNYCCFSILKKCEMLDGKRKEGGGKIIMEAAFLFA